MGESLLAHGGVSRSGRTRWLCGGTGRLSCEHLVRTELNWWNLLNSQLRLGNMGTHLTRL